VRCGYCDFNTYTAKELGGVNQSTFHEHLISEIVFSKQVLGEMPALSSVFIGGGTPSLFSAGQIEAVLESLGASFGLALDCEVTLEANPESTTPEYLAEIAKVGITRLSMGVQSFDRQVLQTLDRQHEPERVAPLIAAANELGMVTSVDLIYGAPGETLDTWSRTLSEALELGTDHVSAYSLIVEPGTKLARQIASGEIGPTSEDLNAEKYELATKSLEGGGLEWYEVSNWGRPSAHNSAYWKSQNWWGYGPGAHSHIDGNRFWNHKHPTSYQKALFDGSPAAGVERLTDHQMLEEELLLMLRTKWGVERELFAKLKVPPELVAQEISQGNLELSGTDRIRVSRKGRLIVDGLVVKFLSH
jgi:oxygen-independent coproporphyrinogen-3 oxidase